MRNHLINSSSHRRGGTRRLGAAFGAALFLQLLCATQATGSGTIQALHVFALPVALNLDNSPGLDGFGLTIYASAAKPAKGLPITSGKLEILMFDGTLPARGPSNAPPSQVWAFTTEELKAHMVKTSLGTGYRFTPRWTTNAPPRKSRITIAARYAPARGAHIQSEATTIPLAAK